MMFAKIQKLSEEDQLSLMRKEVKFKKMVFSELPADFVLFKQYNISASKMYQNLLALHAVNPANQETVSVEDIYEVTDALAPLPSLEPKKRSKKQKKQIQGSDSLMANLQWPPSEKEFIISLEEGGWRFCSAIVFNEQSNTIKAHQLEPIKTLAKDDAGKTYWIYSEEESYEHFEDKHILAIRLSVQLAKNIKLKDPVFALMNREIIDGVTAQMFN